MPTLEQPLLDALRDLLSGLGAVNVRFCIIGALVPQMLLDEPPRQVTKDADAVVVVETLDDFAALKLKLEAFRFRPTSRPIRLQHDRGGLIDILPYSHTVAPDGTLVLPGEAPFNMAGFDKIFASPIYVKLESSLTVPVVPLPLYVLLKLVAFGDRRTAKDLVSVLYCLRHYEENSDRRYGGLDHGDLLVPFEMTTAYMLGGDASIFLDGASRHAVGRVLSECGDVDAPLIDAIGREEGRFLLEPEHRQEIVDLFRWFRMGATL